MSDVRYPCARGNERLWFSEDDEERLTAQILCRGCPIRVECRDGAVERREPWGIWGGELFIGGQPLADVTRRHRTPRDRAVA